MALRSFGRLPRFAWGARMNRAPNLDANDKLVKRGLLVSWHGARAQVQRVRVGRCLVLFVEPVRFPVSGIYRTYGTPQWLPCASVQVVQP